MTSDLSILEDFGVELAPTHEYPPAEVRHRVMNGMRQPVRRRRLLPTLGGVRLAWRIGAPVVAAATVAAVLVAGQLPDHTGGRPAPPDREAGAEAKPRAVPPALPDAGQVLLLAAQHTADTPAMDARPNQFLYIDSVEVQSTIELDKDRNGKIVAGKTKVSAPLRTRTWLSVDGTRDGLVIQEAAKSPTRTHIDGCTNGRRAETIDRPETTPKVACTPEPAYQPGRVSTDPARLLAYAYAIAAAEPVRVSIGAGPDGRPGRFIRLSADQRAFSEVAEILYKNHLPAVQEAAFHAVGRIPGVQARRNVTDAAGRPGVAVTRTEAGTREELVFDPITYRFLGHNLIGAELDLTGAKVEQSPGRGGVQIHGIGSGPKPGDVIYKSALLRVAIVDKAGQRP